jgi:hypothetical protein
MDLIQDLKHERHQKKKKQQLRPGLFARIGGLVQMFSLDSTFVEALDTLPREAPRGALGSGHGRAKPAYRPPFFPLLTEDHYRVTMAILDRVRNPYLQFASSPDEILLCRRLFHRNPSLGAKQLATTHFATLLMAQIAEATPEDSRMGEAGQGS